MKAQERKDLLQVLEARFEKNRHRHIGIAWSDVQARLEGNLDALRSLKDMEATGGEPRRTSPGAVQSKWLSEWASNS